MTTGRRRVRRLVVIGTLLAMYLSTQVLVSRLAERTQRPFLSGDTYMYVYWGPGPGRSRRWSKVRLLADHAMAVFFFPARVVDENLLGGPWWTEDAIWSQDWSDP